MGVINGRARWLFRFYGKANKSWLFFVLCFRFLPSALGGISAGLLSRCWRPVRRLFSIIARFSSSWRRKTRAESLKNKKERHEKQRFLKTWKHLTCCLRIVISSPPIGPKPSNSASLAMVHSANSRKEINKAFQWSELFSRRFLV